MLHYEQLEEIFKLYFPELSELPDPQRFVTSESIGVYIDIEKKPRINKYSAEFFQEEGILKVFVWDINSGQTHYFINSKLTNLNKLNLICQ